MVPTHVQARWLGSSTSVSSVCEGASSMVDVDAFSHIECDAG